MLIDERRGTVYLRYIGHIRHARPALHKAAHGRCHYIPMSKAPQLIGGSHCACSTAQRDICLYGFRLCGNSCRQACSVHRVSAKVKSHLDNRGHSLHRWRGLSCCGPPLVRGRPCAPQQVQVRPLNSEPPGAHTRPLGGRSLQACAVYLLNGLLNNIRGCCKPTCSRTQLLS